MPYTIQDFLQAKSAIAPTFSADGKQVAFLSNLTGTFQVYLASSDAAMLPAEQARQLTDFEDGISIVKFSPVDNDLLLFARDSGGDEMHQLYALRVSSGEVRALTDAPAAQHNFGDWSPDGVFVAYASTKRNGTDYDLYACDTDSGQERLLAMPGGYCSIESVSPTGRYVVFSKARGSFLDTELHLLDLTAPNAAPRLLTPHDDKAFYSRAEWLADESGFYTISDDRSDVAGVRLINLAGGDIPVVQGRWPVEGIALRGDGGMLAVVTNEDGLSKLTQYGVLIRPTGLLTGGFTSGLTERDDAFSKRVQSGFSPEEIKTFQEYARTKAGVIQGMAFSKSDARLALALSSYGGSFQVYVVKDAGAYGVCLAAMPSPVPALEMAASELIHYASFDGLNVPAFLFLPRSGAQDGSKIPAVVYIHGGPEGQFRPSYNPVIQYFAHQGYAVIAPNVRGSDGYGKAYLALDDRHKRMDSVRDLEGLYRWIEADGRIDAKRVALMGGSYGGYMVLAGLAFQPELWAAGVDIVGIANLVTFLENTSPYRRAVREAEYGYLATDREFLASVSPINKADQIRAPLLIIHGANDPRVPLSEAEQMRDTLAARGVHAELLVYPDEGHGLAKLKNRLDAYPKAAEFLAGVFATEPT